MISSRFIRHNIFWVSWLVFITIMCLTPGGESSDFYPPNIDKLVHFFLYFMLSLQMMVGWLKQIQFPFLKYNTIVKVFIISIAYGVFIEVLQGTLFVGRFFEWADIAANITGSIFGILAFIGIYGRTCIR